MGVINPLTPEVETPEEVRDELLTAAKYIPVERLGATDDCGFSPFSRDVKPQARLARLRSRRRDAEDLGEARGGAAGLGRARAQDVHRLDRALFGLTPEACNEPFDPSALVRGQRTCRLYEQRHRAAVVRPGGDRFAEVLIDPHEREAAGISHRRLLLKHRGYLASDEGDADHAQRVRNLVDRGEAAVVGQKCESAVREHLRHPLGLHAEQCGGHAEEMKTRLGQVREVTRFPALGEKRHAGGQDQHRAAGAVQLVADVTADHDVAGRCARLRTDHDQVHRLGA